MKHCTFPRSTRLPFAVLLAACGTLPAVAQSVPAIHFDPAESESPDDTLRFGDRGWAEARTYESQATFGWSFQLTQPAVLTHLAVFDEGGDGLQSSFQVGLWGEAPDISAVVPAGTDAPLDGLWRLAPVEPIRLEPGYYELGAAPAEATADALFMWNFDIFSDADSSKVPFDPRVNVDQSSPTFTKESGFGRPHTYLLIIGAHVGPNAFFIPVPEPSSVVLAFVATVASLSGAARRRHRP
jgi:hypothetical protein